MLLFVTRSGKRQVLVTKAYWAAREQHQSKHAMPHTAGQKLVHTKSAVGLGLLYLQGSSTVSLGSTPGPP